MVVAPTARELLAAYARREVSPVEVLAACEARIAVDGARLGAFATLTSEAARAQARAAEDAWRRGDGRPPAPLCGVPLAVKDVFDTAGVETACGSRLLAGRVPARDAEAVRRCRAAGAVLVGKTRTHEFAWGLTMRGADGAPVTRNPWDPARLPGGSSGGSAVAVATGMVPLALGTDTGGSIRLPAAWCRITGHKPTHGRVPLEGVWPLAPSLDHAGPMASTPDDCALLLGVLDGTGEPRAEVPDGLRVAGPESLPAGDRVARCYQTLLLAEALAVHRASGLWPARAADYAPHVRRRLELAEALDPGEVGAAAAEREVLRAEVDALWTDVDLVRSPVAAIGPPRWDAQTDLRREVTPHVALQDLLGLPACALPDGTQLTGPPGADALVLAAASRAGPTPLR